jgi:hypothetical protein
VQFLVSLFDSLAGYTFPLYNTLPVQKPLTGSTELHYAALNRDLPGWTTN